MRLRHRSGGRICNGSAERWALVVLAATLPVAPALVPNLFGVRALASGAFHAVAA